MFSWPPRGRNAVELPFPADVDVVQSDSHSFGPFNDAQGLRSPASSSRSRGPHQRLRGVSFDAGSLGREYGVEAGGDHVPVAASRAARKISMKRVWCMFSTRLYWAPAPSPSTAVARARIARARSAPAARRNTRPRQEHHRQGAQCDRSQDRFSDGGHHGCLRCGARAPPGGSPRLPGASPGAGSTAAPSSASRAA